MRSIRVKPGPELSDVSPEFPEFCGRLRLVLLGLALVVCFVSSCRTGGGVAGLLKILPAEGGVAGWRMKGDSQVFAGQDLFTYIDGGADIYLEYGFRTVLVQDYQGPAGKTISAEIFEMANSDAAFGMYAFKKGSKGREVGGEGRGQMGDYYLNIWKGRFLITLTGFDSDSETLIGLEALARAAEARTGGSGDKPRFLNTLPAKYVIKPSLRYFRGPLGLNSVLPALSRDAPGFEEGAAADYDTGMSLIVLRYPGRGACRAAFERLRAALSDPARFYEFQDAGEDLAAASDAKGKTIYATPRGDLLWIVRGGSRAAVRSFLSTLRRPQ